MTPYEMLRAERAGWSDAQKRAYVIADNKLTENAGWDEGVLRLELGELQFGEFDLRLTGFSGDELKELFAPGTAGLVDPEDTPEPPQAPPQDPVSRLGDLWICGEAVTAAIFWLKTRACWSEYSAAQMPKPLGKKEQASIDAEAAAVGTEWGNLVH